MGADSRNSGILSLQCHALCNNF